MIGKIVRSIAKTGAKISTAGLSKGPHITRYYMYDRLERFKEVRPLDAKVLSISHSQNLAEMLGYQLEQVFDAAYPDYTILNLPFEDNHFDAVVSDQVLEHVKGDPKAAMNEAFRVLKPGGIALHTTCFINPVHGRPEDYWRFTPEALKYLVEDHADIIEVAGWGNPLAWVYSELGLRFEPIPHAKWHPFHRLAMKNHKDWPIVTWVLAKKRGV